MKKLCVLAFVLASYSLRAQYQIAVYHPADKTTKIAPTFDSAYSIAQAGDYIYLPVGTFTSSSPIAKKLNIIGVGIDVDSSRLGISSFSSAPLFEIGSDNSFLEGISFTNNQPLTIGGSTAVSNLVFQRCYISQLTTGVSFSCSNMSFNECLIDQINGRYNSNWTFSKCIIRYSITYLQNSTFANNIFGINSQNTTMLANVRYSTFYNNIFNGQPIDNDATNSGFQLQNCSFIDNINTNLYSPTLNEVTNDYTVPWSSIFVNAKADSIFQSDYHLAAGNPARNGGNDGTDVGIYGTGQPCKPGWVPSNPHIFYQKLSVDANGLLHATFKVHPQNY
ncbi:MAG: hypothetical protein ACTHMM_21985 [Agriterribacter sp.]